MHDRGIGVVQPDQSERKRFVEGVLCGRVVDPRPRLDRANWTNVDEVTGQFNTRVRIPFQRWTDHAVAASDPDDPLLGKGSHERAQDRT